MTRNVSSQEAYIYPLTTTQTTGTSDEEAKEVVHGEDPDDSESFFAEDSEDAEVDHAEVEERRIGVLNVIRLLEERGYGGEVLQRLRRRMEPPRSDLSEETETEPPSYREG